MTATRLDGEDCALLTTPWHRCPDDGYEMALNVSRIRCLSPSLGTSTYALQHACHENIPPQVSVLGFDERQLPIYVPSPTYSAIPVHKFEEVCTQNRRQHLLSYDIYALPHPSTQGSDIPGSVPAITRFYIALPTTATFQILL
jgi:hypothetical protein